jgi:2-polyprenyl-6-hydroxyphenyl methylase / 3-demethylubiquinone-9 3-methyltransferase
LHHFFTSDKKTLDLGCSSGYGSVFLENASSYLGVDISPETIEECTSKFSRDNIKFKVENAQKLDLLDASFDVITCFEVLEHVTEPEKIVLEASRVFSSNGILFHQLQISITTTLFYLNLTLFTSRK